MGSKLQKEDVRKAFIYNSEIGEQECIVRKAAGVDLQGRVAEI